MPRVDRYQLIELLGRGGMAEVWKASVEGPHGFRRLVALKRPLGELASDPSFLAMFAKEARILSRLHHPNVVGVFELGEHEGRPYLVTELVEGLTLGRLLRAHKALPAGCAALITRELARALAYVHTATDEGKRLALIHRDLSPTNVMVGFDGSVRLLDFGIAKALEGALDERTRTGVLKGKVHYMSPEQAAGGALDHRSDQFSLGILLYEMLTGKRPFGGDGEAVVLRRVQEAQPEAPSQITQVPRALEAICLRMLARDPKERFADCEAVAAALDPLLDGWGPRQLAEQASEVRDGTGDRPAPLPRTNKLDRAAPRRRWWWAALALPLVAAAALLLRPKPVVVEKPMIAVAKEAPPAVIVDEVPSPPPVHAAPPRLIKKKHPSREQALRRDITTGKIVDPFH